MKKAQSIDGRSKVLFGNRKCEIEVDLSSGSWSVRDKASGLWSFKDAHLRIDNGPGSPWREAETVISWEQREVQSCFGKGRELIVTSSPVEGYQPVRMLRLRLYNGLPFVEIGWGVRNRFDYAIRVQNAEVLYGGELFVDQRIARPRVLRSGAGAEPNFVENGWEVKAFNGALLTCECNGERRSLVAGGLAYSEFARIIEFRDGHAGAGSFVRNKGFKNVNLSFWDPQGRLIDPGATYWSDDSAYLDCVTRNPFDALEAYGEALHLANNAAPNEYDFPTLCGWMTSTRNLGEGKPINNSTGLVEQTKAALDRGLMKYTPLAVRLEPDTYCYGGYGDTQQGWWDDAHWSAQGPGQGSPNEKVPKSLCPPYETFAKFCKAVSALGGIPFTYFQGSMPSNDFAVAHPDWMLNKDISRLHHTHAHHRPLVRYDYTNPRFQAHVLRVWQRLRKAGLKGVKFDYPESAWARYGGFANKHYTTTAAYRELYALCREGLGDDAFIHERNLGGRTHEDAPRLDVTAGIVDLQRVWGDASHFEPEMASRMGLRWYKSRRVFLYYPDGKSFLMNGKPLPAYKRRAFLTIIAFLSGRLEIGTSLGSMTDEMLHDLTRVFPMLGGDRSPRPVDMLAGGAHPAVYLYPVKASWWQVMLINNNKRGSKTVSTRIADDQVEHGGLGLERDARYHAFDFWRQDYLGEFKGSDALSVELRAGEVAMVSLRRALEHPQVVSTNRHIMQGMMECSGVRWSEARGTLSGKVAVVVGEMFVLTVACNGRRINGCDGATIRKRRGGLVDLLFSSQKNADMRFRLRFVGRGVEG